MNVSKKYNYSNELLLNINCSLSGTYLDMSDMFERVVKFALVAKLKVAPFTIVYSDNDAYN